MKKFAVHPGYVTSKSDGQQHYITATRLASLYELRPNEYVVWDAFAHLKLKFTDYIHLYPSYDGYYGRANAERANS